MFDEFLWFFWSWRIQCSVRRRCSRSRPPWTSWSTPSCPFGSPDSEDINGYEFSWLIIWDNQKRSIPWSLLHELSSRFWGLGFHIRQDDFSEWRNKSDTTCSSELEIQNDLFLFNISFSKHSVLKRRTLGATCALRFTQPRLHMLH